MEYLSLSSVFPNMKWSVHCTNVCRILCMQVQCCEFQQLSIKKFIFMILSLYAINHLLHFFIAALTERALRHQMASPQLLSCIFADA